MEVNADDDEVRSSAAGEFAKSVVFLFFFWCVCHVFENVFFFLVLDLIAN
jgi:hypothetical protein